MLRRKLEADLTQYYGADLRDLFDPNSKMTVRWVISHLINLPEDSRIHKHFRNDAFDSDQHLLATIVDLLKSTAYWSSVNAAAQVGKDFQKAVKGAPKPMERPTILPEEKKKQFTPIREARAKMDGLLKGG